MTQAAAIATGLDSREPLDRWAAKERALSSCPADEGLLRRKPQNPPGQLLASNSTTISRT